MRLDTWRAMSGLVPTHARAIGLCNVSETQLATLIAFALVRYSVLLTCKRYLDDETGHGVPRTLNPDTVSAHTLTPQKEKLPLPAVVQNEMHPLLPAARIRDMCRQHGIVFQAYSSLGGNALGLLTHPVVTSIAERVGRSPAQVLLRWALDKGVAVLPRSSRKEGVQDNA
jgi:diketogulonate reductase-like aldo/keto reductase